jgi:hypothetical protein
MSIGNSRANQNMWTVGITVFAAIWALATSGQAATARS